MKTAILKIINDTLVAGVAPHAVPTIENPLSHTGWSRDCLKLVQWGISTTRGNVVFPLAMEHTQYTIWGYNKTGEGIDAKSKSATGATFPECVAYIAIFNFKEDQK